MFLSNKPGVPPGINLLQKPIEKLSRPSGNLANPVIFSRKPGEDKDTTGSVTEECLVVHDCSVILTSYNALRCSL